MDPGSIENFVLFWCLFLVPLSFIVVSEFWSKLVCFPVCFFVCCSPPQGWCSTQILMLLSLRAKSLRRFPPKSLLTATNSSWLLKSVLSHQQLQWIDTDQLARIAFTRAEATLCLVSAVPRYQGCGRQLCGAAGSRLSRAVCWVGLLDQMPDLTFLRGTAEISSLPCPDEKGVA